MAACRHLDQLGAGVRWGFSLGNAAGAGFAELVEVVAADRAVREIALLVEEIPDWEAFKRAAGAARRAGKWMGAVCIGRTPAGREVALTHTGALAGNLDLLAAGLSQAGIRVAESLPALLAATALHSRLGDPAPGGVGIVGVSGGAMGLAADAAGRAGLELPRPAARTRTRISAANPDCRPGNPLDIVGGPRNPERFRAAIDAFMRDPAIAVTVFMPSQGVPDEQLPDHLQTLESVLTVSRAAEAPLIVTQPLSLPVPSAQRQLVLSVPSACLVPTLDETLAGLRLWLPDRATARPGRSAERRKRVEPVLAADEGKLKQALADAGCEIPTGLRLTGAVARRFAAGAAPPAALARLGSPLVAKGLSRHVLHKTAAGLVELDLADTEQLRAAVSRLLTRPEASAVLVERMVGPGQDLLVGLFRDRLGTAVAIGAGGARAGTEGSRWLGIAPSDSELTAGFARVLGRSPDRRTGAALIGFVRHLLAAFQGRGWTFVEVNPARLLPGGSVVALDAVAFHHGKEIAP